jgi:hypothetical protein
MQIANSRPDVVLRNDVEGKNYAARQHLADDPTAIIWCTEYVSNPNVKPFTIPIVGKLTSANKRPKPSTQQVYSTDSSGTYNPELPGPDGMYGTSGNYRYGFDPAGQYHEFSESMEMHCTTVPDMVQRQTTMIAIGNAGGNLVDLARNAQEAIKRCRATNPNGDPTVPCPEAVSILGGVN